MASYTVQNLAFGINPNDTKEIDELIHFICTKLTSNESGTPQDCPQGGTGVESMVKTTRSTAILDGTESMVLTSLSTDVPEEDSFYTMMGVSRSNQIIHTILFCTILILALLGNGMVLVTVFFNKTMWTTMHMFIVSLAISDLLVSTTCIPLNIGQTLNTEWTFGSLSCQLMPFFMQVSITASILTLCCMAAERYVAIVHPLKLNSLLQTTDRALLLLTAVWLVAFAAGMPFAFMYDTRKLCFSSEQCQTAARHTICGVKQESRDVAVNSNWATFFILFVLPALVLGIAYGIIIYKLWVKAPIGVVMISAAGMRTRYKKKAVKMLSVVVVFFLASWAPLLTFELIIMEHSDIHVSEGLINLKFYLQCLALSSTAYNPIIYALMNQKFRTNFRALFQRHRGRVVPMATEKDDLQQGGQLNATKTAPTNSATLKTDISTKQTKSTRL